MVSQSSATRRDWGIWALALCVTLVAFFTHLYGLGDLRPVPRHDPAYNGLDALRVVRRGLTPILFPANGGREPLFIYLQALAFWKLGVNSFALRLPGALAGAVAVPTLFGLTRSLSTSENHLVARWVPAWASLGLALSVWHVSQTRLGLRAALLPLMSIGVVWLFTTGWRRASLLRLAAAGALLGLTIYSYTAARFLPLVLLLAALPDLLAKPADGTPSRWGRWLGFGMLTLSSVVVFAPLGWYYLHHPVMFADRASSVMVWNVWQPGSGSTLAEELLMNGWSTVVRFARFPVPLFAGLVVGLGVALTRLRRLEYRLLPIWWLVMLLPDVLTTETPHLLRSLGAAPPTYLLVGIGLAAIATWLTHRWPISVNVTLAAGLLVLALGSFPLWKYFQPAETDPLAGTLALAETLVAGTQTGAVYLPLSAYADPSLRFLLATEFEQRANWSVDTFSPSQLIQPVEDSDSRTLVHLSPDGWVTLLPPLRDDGQTALQSLAGDGQPIIDRYGTVAGYKVQLPDSANPANYLVQASFAADAAVTGVADLVGYSADSSTTSDFLPHLAPGSPLRVTTFWRAHGDAGEDYDMVVHLIDDAGRLWGHADGPPIAGAYPTSMWRPDEQVADGRLLWVDPGAPPGRYWLDVAFYDYTIDSRLPVAGGSIPDTIRLGPLKIPLPPITEPPANVQTQPAEFGNIAQLLGYRLDIQPTAFTLTLYWQADSPIEDDFTVFVHLLDVEGQLMTGQDSQPMGGSYPTGIWEPGEIIADERTFDTSTLPPGEYQIEAGMYLLDTGERLPVYLPDGTEDSARRLVLNTPIQVQ